MKYNKLYLILACFILCSCNVQSKFNALDAQYNPYDPELSYRYTNTSRSLAKHSFRTRIDGDFDLTNISSTTLPKLSFSFRD